MKPDPLIELLFSIQSQPEDSLDFAAITSQIKEKFLIMGSETEDNVNAIQNLEYSFVDGSYPPVSGLKIKDKNISLTDISHFVEGMDIPEPLKENYPSLTQRDWESAMRMITMILLGLEFENSFKAPQPVYYDEETGTVYYDEE